MKESHVVWSIMIMLVCKKIVSVYLLIREGIAQLDENTDIRFPFFHFYANQCTVVCYVWHALDIF